MGTMRHNAIIVTGSYSERTVGSRIDGEERHWADIAQRQAVDIFGEGQVTPVVVAELNDIRTFMVAPDGSKEGWDESDAGDAKRNEFIEWLEGQAYEDGSSPLQWVEVFYASDDGARAGVARHS